VISRAGAPFVLFGSILALAACSRSEAEAPPDAAAASAPMTPAPDPSFAVSHSPLLTETARALPSRVVRVADRTAVVAITNQTSKPVAHAAVWHYFYDDGGKCIDRGRGMCDVAIAPGATKECSLTIGDADFLPRAYRTLEAEAFEAIGADGVAIWANDNLVPPCAERPRGGVSDDQLRARTGMRILSTFSGKMRDRPVFFVKNVADKRTEKLDGVVFYYDKDGGLLRRYEALPQKLVIDPEHYAETEIGFARIDLPAGTQVIELAIWRVRYVDGSEWQNANLKSARRKMAE
jgi:hypothetical protein